MKGKSRKPKHNICFENTTDTEIITHDQRSSILWAEEKWKRNDQRYVS